MGDQIWFVALSWSAVELASPSAAGAVMAIAAVPRLTLMLLGGVVVDRLGPKRLMIGSDLIRAAVMATAAAVALNAPSIGLLVAVSLVFGVVSAVFTPAASAMGPLLLHRSQLASGAALSTLGRQLASVLGAPLGGFLVAFGGLALGAAANALTFAVSAMFLWTLRPRKVHSEHDEGVGAFALAMQGLRYLRDNRLVGLLLLAGVLMNVGFVGPANLGLALLSQARGWDALGVGVMSASIAVGTGLVSAVLLKRTPAGGLGVVLAGCSATQGAAIFGLASTPTLWLAALVCGLAGVCAAVMGVLLNALVQTHTEDAYRGRVGGVSGVVNLGLPPLAMAAVGLLAGEIGLIATFGLCALFSAAAGALCLGSGRIRAARLG